MNVSFRAVAEVRERAQGQQGTSPGIVGGCVAQPLSEGPQPWRPRVRHMGWGERRMLRWRRESQKDNSIEEAARWG